jgi:hypothetical protein
MRVALSFPALYPRDTPNIEMLVDPLLHTFLRHKKDMTMCPVHSNTILSNKVSTRIASLKSVQILSGSTGMFWIVVDLQTFQHHTPSKKVAPSHWYEIQPHNLCTVLDLNPPHL